MAPDGASFDRESGDVDSVEHAEDDLSDDGVLVAAYAVETRPAPKAPRVGVVGETSVVAYDVSVVVDEPPEQGLV